MITISGKHAVTAVLKNEEREIKQIYCLDRTLSSISSLVKKRNLENKVQVVDKTKLDALVKEDVNHQGLALQCSFKKEKSLQDALKQNRVLILDQVTDSKNVGAIIRSAAAFGIKTIIMQDKHSPEENNLMAQAASGGLEFVDLIKVANLTKTIKLLKENEFWVAALTVNTKQDIKSLNKFKDNKLALVAGSEGKGLRRLVEENCDFGVKIDIREESQSLNVSTSVAIALYLLSF